MVKRLRFEKYPRLDVWKIKNKRGEIIGTIIYHPAWKRHIFETSSEYIHSYGCLREIADFMESLGGKA